MAESRGSGDRLTTEDLPTAEVKCSFCGKPQSMVARIVCGPRSIAICNECVDLCREIMDEELS